MTLPVMLVVCSGSRASGDLAQALAREGIAVAEERPPLAGAPTTPLILGWLPAAADENTLAELLRLRQSAGTPCALLGCAPDGSGADSERALAVGFDDFVAGRQSPRELAGRLRALARRLVPSAGSLGRLGVGRMTLDASGHDLWIGDRRVRLTRLESRTLAALMRAPGHALSRVELMGRVWGDGSTGTSLRAVDNLVQRLRRKVGDAELIVTIRGLGFRLRPGDG
jgi:DNA-binding response OmpR family regulator